MAKLPNRSRARVPPRKITHYLLDRNHPVGGKKATFFERFGFRLDTARELEDALIAHAYNCDVIKIRDNGFGHNYVLEGPLQTPYGDAPIVLSIWFIDASKLGWRLPVIGSAPSFVTAYPSTETKS